MTREQRLLRTLHTGRDREGNPIDLSLWGIGGKKSVAQLLREEKNRDVKIELIQDGPYAGRVCRFASSVRIYIYCNPSGTEWYQFREVYRKSAGGVIVPTDSDYLSETRKRRGIRKKEGESAEAAVWRAIREELRIRARAVLTGLRRLTVGADEIGPFRESRFYPGILSRNNFVRFGLALLPRFFRPEFHAPEDGFTVVSKFEEVPEAKLPHWLFTSESSRHDYLSNEPVPSEDDTLAGFGPLLSHAAERRFT